MTRVAATRVVDGIDPSLAHVLGHLAVLDARVRAAVERRREDGQPDDPFRGLYVSEEDVDRLLAGDRGRGDRLAGRELAAGVEREADVAEAAGAVIRLRRVAAAFGLEPLDLELLLVALAPDVDARFERLYGYLQDDVSRRRASLGLALELAGAPEARAAARYRLSECGPLVAGGLVLVEEADRPFLTRALRVPDRVAMHLLGGDRVDPVLAPLVVPAAPACTPGDAASLARAIGGGCTLVYLRDRGDSAGRALAKAAFARLGMEALVLDLARLGAAADVADIARAAVREARLAGAGLVAGPIERLAELDALAARLLAESPWPTVLAGAGPWDTTWSRQLPLVVEVGAPSEAERARVWRSELDGDLPPDADPVAATSHFRLGPEEVARAARAARLRARIAGRPLTVDDLHAGARLQNAPALDRLARRVSPRVRWEDLVLPEETIAALRELADRALHRERVLDGWGLAALCAGRGVTALFTGEPGTGKTMAAEVLAHALGVDLYAIDLSTVVDKYVGETEKNLDRVFRATEGVHGILFFDEADALFGKRSDVRDAHDRYANLEVAYLLQRMETFDGVAILATNLRANMDEAFSRRLDALVDFPLPDRERRRRLWERCLGAGVPRGDDVDLGFCAQAFELSGGSIRNIALTAAYQAAGSGGRVGMAELMLATKREYRKLGRLCSEAEFGPYYPLIAEGERPASPRGGREAAPGRTR